MSIFNYFGETLSWDIFTQGVFFSFILYLSGYLIYITQVSNYEEEDKERKNINDLDTENTEKKSYLRRYWINLKKSISEFPKRKIDIKHAIKTFSPFVKSFLRFKLILFPLVLVLIFTIGIIVHTVADSWIDKNNHTHFGLKSYWADDLGNDLKETQNLFNHCKNEDKIDFSKFNDYQGTDTGIKLIAFDKIFRNHKNICPVVKLQIYYNIKHKLLSEEQWRGYLSYSQVLINLTQGIALSFFFLMLLSSANLLAYIIRKKYLLSTIIFLAVIVLYLLSGAYSELRIIQEWIIWLIIGVGILNLALYKKRKILINLSFIILAMGGYCLASNSWISNEYEVCYKTYGVYKIIDNKLNYNEIEELYK